MRTFGETDDGLDYPFDNLLPISACADKCLLALLTVLDQGYLIDTTIIHQTIKDL